MGMQDTIGHLWSATSPETANGIVPSHSRRSRITGYSRLSRYAVIGLFILLSALPAFGDIADLAYEVRVIRYAATGNCAKIEGTDDTPVNAQAWLNAIAAALAEASGFFVKPTCIAKVWSYPAVSLSVSSSGTGPNGGCSETDTANEIAKVTWVVRTPLPYVLENTKITQWLGATGMDWTFSDAVAQANSWSLHSELPASALPTYPGTRHGIAGVLVASTTSSGACWYLVYFDLCTVEGYYRAPGDHTVNPIGAGTGTPPPAEATDYYLGRHGGTALPGAHFKMYHPTWPLNMTDPATLSDSEAPETPPPTPPSTMPSMFCPPDPGCPAYPNPPIQTYNYTFQEIGVTYCPAHIKHPVERCDGSLCTTNCGSVSGSSCSGGHCSPVFSVNESDLTVQVTDIPVWAQSHTGPALQVQLSFDSGDTIGSGDFGWGWKWGYSMTIFDYGAGVKIVSSGRGRSSWWFISNGDGTFDGPSGATLSPASGGWIMEQTSGDRYTFNGNGKLTAIANRFGAGFQLSYDSNGRVQSMTDAGGASLTFTRDAAGRVTAATVPGGRSATFTYDADGFLVECVDMGGMKCGYEYGRFDGQTDNLNRPGPITAIRKNVTDNGADVTTFRYLVSPADGQQELCVTDPEGGVTTYRWDHGNTEVFTKIEPSGAVTSEVHGTIGGRNVLLAKIDALEHEWTYEYDTGGFLTKETDPLGNQTTYARNSRGKVLTEARPGGATTTYTYAANGEDVLTKADALENVTTYTYDANRNLLTNTNALGQTTTYTYDGQGRRLTETTPAGLVTTNTYDTAGRLLSTSTSLGATTTYTYNSRGLVASVTSPDGLTTQKSYDDLDRVTQETYLDANGTPASSVSYTYGCCGVTQTVSPTGAIAANLYDANKRLIATTDHFGNTTQFEYDGNGNRTKVRDALGNETVTTYDVLNRSSTVTHPDGTTESFVYDALGRQIRHTDRSGKTQVTEYDVRGNVTAAKIGVPGDPDPVTYTIETTTYDLADQRMSSTNADGLTVVYTYDTIGRVLTESYPDSTAVTSQYGVAGMTSRTDRLGHTTSYTYDIAGRVLTVTDPLNHTTTYTYTPSGKQATVTNALGQVTSFTYDQEGRLVQTTYPGGTTETRTYANNSMLTSQTDRTGIVTSFTYDAMGRRLTTAVAGQTVDTVTYDALDRTATQTDARGITVTMTYDSMGRVTRRTMSDGTHEDLAYGPSGVLTHTDRAGRTTTYTYGALGRKASETNPNNETIGYEYDLSGRMTKLIDANTSQTQWAYDTQGRMTRKTYADGSHYDYTYDANGRMLTRTDAMNLTTTYSYDANGNLLGIDYPNDTDVAYTYDALGRRLTMTDASGTTTWTYDSATGKPATDDGPFDNDTLAFPWDAAGRRLSTAPDGNAVATYAYDALGRRATVSAPASIPNPPPSTFTYTYAGASAQVTNLAMPGGLSTAKTYDTLGRLTSVVNQSGTGVSPVIISSFAYTYDNSDRRTRVVLADTGHWQYSYDSAGQVTGGTRYGPKLSDNAEAVLAQYGYQYDAMGNPTQRSEDAAVSAYTFNNLNQLVSGAWSGTLSAFGWTKPVNLAGVSVTAGEQTQAATVFKKGEWTAKGLQVPAGDTTLTVTRTAQDNSTVTAQTSVTRPADGVAFTHDLNGNMLTDGRWTYTWDDENRLVAAETAAGAPASSRARIECVYDAQSRRRIQREYTWATDDWSLITEHFYTWDGWLLVRELRTSGGVTRTLTYLHGLDLAGRMACAGEDAMTTAGGIGGILAVTVSSPSTPDPRPLTLFFYDGNGNVVDLADSITGTNAAHYEYGPFGNVSVKAGPLAEINRLRSSTKEQDQTGLCYYGYRYYASGMGRWLCRDPIGEDGGRNLYAFVGNTPTYRVDLLGLTSGLRYGKPAWLTTGSLVGQPCGCEPTARIVRQRIINKFCTSVGTVPTLGTHMYWCHADPDILIVGPYYELNWAWFTCVRGRDSIGDIGGYFPYAGPHEPFSLNVYYGWTDVDGIKHPYLTVGYTVGFTYCEGGTYKRANVNAVSSVSRHGFGSNDWWSWD